MEYFKEILSIRMFIHYFSIFIMTVFCFLGAHLVFKGNFLFSVPIAIVLPFAYIGTVSLLQSLKKVGKDQKQMKFWEFTVYWFLYPLIIGFGSLYFFAHAANIYYFNKSEIQSNSIQYLGTCDKLIINYERYVDSLANRWETEIDNKFLTSTSYGERQIFCNKYEIIPFESANLNETRIQTTKRYVAAFKNRMSDGFQLKKDSILTYAETKRRTFENWNYINIPIFYHKMQDDIDMWINETENLSTLHKRSTEAPFKFVKSYTILKDISNPKLFFGNWMYILPIFLLVFYVLIPWPYIFEERAGQRDADGKSGEPTGFEM